VVVGDGAVELAVGGCCGVVVGATGEVDVGVVALILRYAALMLHTFGGLDLVGGSSSLIESSTSNVLADVVVGEGGGFFLWTCGGG
jgi:hypothetical protein